jgi:Mor family transcriptional regulator
MVDFDAKSPEYLDAFLVLLLFKSQETILPEILECVGRDALFKFLEIFGGTTVKVPTKEFIERTMRNAAIYVDVVKKKKPVPEVAQRFELNDSTIRQIVRETEGLFEGLSL